MSTSIIIIIIGIVALILGAVLGFVFSKSGLNSKANYIIKKKKKNRSE